MAKNAKIFTPLYKFFRKIFFKNFFTEGVKKSQKKAISIVRGKNNTLPPLAESRIRIYK